ncbi:MAG: SufS family cysteine desulfurase [Nanoarchaeota archaeon]
MKINNNIAKKLKKDFPIFKNNPGLIYLDNAATSQRPKQVIKAVTDFYEKENANAGRGVYTLAEKAMIVYNESRKVVAKFIGADSNEIVFTRNATESLNLLSYTLLSIIPKGKNEILLTEMEHHSNLVPWQQMAKRSGMVLKFVKIKEDFTLDLEDAKRKITEKTAVFAFTAVSNVLGTVNPMKELTKIAKQKGALVIIDGAQAVSHIKVNVKDIGCDFFAFSSHKMLGPGGIGVLYGRKELLEKMRPFNFGGGMIKNVGFDSTEFANIPEKFEAGTQHIADAVGLAEAIKYLEKIGMKNVSEWEKKLTEYAYSKLSTIEGVKIYSFKNSSSIVSFTLEGVHGHDIAELLNRDKIAIRAGHQCAMPLMNVLGVKGGVCRISFSFYNTFEDVDKLIKSLKKVKEKFKKR